MAEKEGGVMHVCFCIQCGRRKALTRDCVFILCEYCAPKLVSHYIALFSEAKQDGVEFCSPIGLKKNQKGGGTHE